MSGARLEVGIPRRKTAATKRWAVYDQIGGTFLTRLDEEPRRTPVQLDRPRLDPLLEVVEPAKRLDAIVAKYETIAAVREQLSAA